jgi:chloride channel 7
MLIRFPFLWGFDLGYRIIENDLFDQNWRSRGKADQVRYVVLKWTFCFAIGIITGIAGFVINLAVENVAGLKHTAVSALMESSRFCSLPPIALSKKKVMLLLLSTTNSLMLVSCFVYYYPVLFLSLIRSILVQI